MIPNYPPETAGDLLEIISGVPHEVPTATWEILAHKKRSPKTPSTLK
jgi:hypothetical protein